MTVDKIVTQKEELEIIGATLLSIEEAEKLPLRLRKYNRWWWLRSPGYFSNFATGVSSGGSVDRHGYRVSSSIVAVRPALIIKNLKSSNLKILDQFEFGGKIFEVISKDTSFCLEDIGIYTFRKNYKIEDNNANDYEKSDIKKFVDDWFENANKEK